MASAKIKNMNNISKLIFTSLACCGLTAVAAEIDLSKLPPASTQKDVTYAKDIRPMLEPSCFRCHGEDKHSGGLRLDSREAVLKGGRKKDKVTKEEKIVTVVEVGNSGKSRLVISVAQLNPKTAMPPKRKGGGGGPGGSGGPGGPGGPRDDHDAKPQGERLAAVIKKDAGTNAPAGGPRPGGPPAKPLTAEQVGLVRAWIDQGAK